MFRPVEAGTDFPRLERETMRWWEESGVVEEYLTRNDDSQKVFSFLDGPITANNPMGVHHAWGRTYKDLFQRYMTMKGYRQRYQNGFDCQGLWVEVEVEKELGLGSKRDIEGYGMARFVEKCKERVMKYADIQTQQSQRLGYWMDWDNSYFTMSDENNYAIWQFLKECHRRGWIYKGYDVMPWCPRCGTGLSEHEIVTEGYKEVEHPSLFFRVPLRDREGEYFLAWTTTPWTVPANVALAVNPEEDYVLVEIEGDLYYLSRHLKDAFDGQVRKTLKGESLVGLEYSGPFDELEVQQGVKHQVISWEDVDPEEGTGIVHIAPGCGREDFALGQEMNLPVIKPIDQFGVFVSGFGPLSGLHVDGTAPAVADSLREKGFLFRMDTIRHRYPVCWRCSTELVFRLVDEWFISMDELRHEIMEVVPRIRWIPGFGEEREMDWLRNMGDWMISKKRFWGLALPIYQCQCGWFDVIGSREELGERAAAGWDEFEGHTPHRPWVDSVTIRCQECGEEARRIEDVGNPWLDAGIVPFSTFKYWEDRDYWKTWFPADFITESFPGQFRNWFYSLLCMSTVLAKQEPFKCVLGYGLVKDEQGDDMHKSKGNAIWFEEGAEEMGADSMRWIYSLANPASNLNFGYKVVSEARRRFILPLWNVYSFFVTYARLDDFNPVDHHLEPLKRPGIDRWLLSRLSSTVASVREFLDDYDARGAARTLDGFVEDLSNWYVRRCRRRYWKSAQDEDKTAAYLTLYETLVAVSKLLAPFLPFVAESMYRNLVARVSPEAPRSVHLCDYPEPNAEMVSDELEFSMAGVRNLVALGRAARNQAGIKIRQPLSALLVAEGVAWSGDLEHHLLEELNVKEIRSVDSISRFRRRTLTPRVDVMGPKYREAMPDILRAVESMDDEEIDRLARMVLSGQELTLGGHQVDPDDFEVGYRDREGYATADDGEVFVAIPTALTHQLKMEGLARELIRHIQNLRREAGFEVDDQIVVYFRGEGELAESLELYGDYVCQETLATEIRAQSPPPSAHQQEKNLNGHQVQLAVRRVTST